MQSIKIVHIVEGFTGGLVTYMKTVLPGLVDSGKMVTLIYSAKRADPDCMEVIEKLQIKGVSTIEIPFKREIGLGDLFTFLKLYLILRKERFDLVHTHCSKAGFLGRLAARAVGTKAVCHTPHCFISNRTSNRFKAGLFLWLERIAALLTHKTLFVSDSERFFALENKVVRPRDSEIISNGLSFGELRSERRDNIMPFLKDEDRCVTFAGRLVKYKNPDLLIKAAALIENKNIKFMICGNGPEFENLQSLINEKGLSERVCLAGHVRDMSKVYNLSDIFVICSDAEGQPYALLEAMAYGCCCIGVKAAGITDILEHGQTGLICEKTAFDIARSIEYLVSDYMLRQKLAKNANTYVTSNHSLEIQVRSLDDFYDQMLSEAS